MMYYNYAVFYLDILRTMASSSDVFFWGGSTDVGTKDLAVGSYPHDVPTIPWVSLGYDSTLPAPFFAPGHGLKVLSYRTMMKMRRRWTWENGLSLWSHEIPWELGIGGSLRGRLISGIMI